MSVQIRPERAAQRPQQEERQMVVVRPLDFVGHPRLVRSDLPPLPAQRDDDVPLFHQRFAEDGQALVGATGGTNGLGGLRGRRHVLEPVGLLQPLPPRDLIRGRFIERLRRLDHRLRAELVPRRQVDPVLPRLLRIMPRDRQDQPGLAPVFSLYPATPSSSSRTLGWLPCTIRPPRLNTSAANARTNRRIRAFSASSMSSGIDPESQIRTPSRFIAWTPHLRGQQAGPKRWADRSGSARRV